MRRGFLIVFEGSDGSGKSTQVDMIRRRLVADGFACVVTEEPGGTEAGGRIRDVVLDPALALCPKAELFLFLADRSEHVDKVISPSLREGKVVISSRYFHSTLVYQGIARKVAELGFLEELNLFAVDNVRPDVVFYLDVTPGEGLAKAIRARAKPYRDNGGDRIEREGVSLQERVRDGYLSLASKHPDTFVVVDGRDAIDEVGDRIYEETKRRLLRD